MTWILVGTKYYLKPVGADLTTISHSHSPPIRNKILFVMEFSDHFTSTSFLKTRFMIKLLS